MEWKPNMHLFLISKSQREVISLKEEGQKMKLIFGGNLFKVVEEQ